VVKQLEEVKEIDELLIDHWLLRVFKEYLRTNNILKFAFFAGLFIHDDLVTCSNFSYHFAILVDLFVGQKSRDAESLKPSLFDFYELFVISDLHFLSVYPAEFGPVAVRFFVSYKSKKIKFSALMVTLFSNTPPLLKTKNNSNFRTMIALYVLAFA